MAICEDKLLINERSIIAVLFSLRDSTARSVSTKIIAPLNATQINKLVFVNTFFVSDEL